MKLRAHQIKTRQITAAELRVEGVFDVGRVGSIIWVNTEDRVVLFHESTVREAFTERGHR